MAEPWGINIYFVWKSTIVPLSVCRGFLVIIYICVTKSRSFFAYWTIFFKKCLHKPFFLNMAERWSINIYVIWKTTIVPLSVCRAFFSYNLYLRDKSRSFFAYWTIFCKKCLHKQFFPNMAERWGINIYVIWKTTIVYAERFLVIICICVTNHVLFLLTGRYFVKNAYISNFFSTGRNAGV